MFAFFISHTCIWYVVCECFNSAFRVNSSCDVFITRGQLWPWTFHIRSAAIRYLWTIDQNMKTFSDECSRNSGVYENREYRPTICLMIMYHTCIMSWSIVLELVRLTRSFTLASPPCGTCCQRRRVWRLLRTHFVWLRLRGLGRRHV